MEEIKKIRKETGLTMAEFSKRLGIPYRTIQDWEAGRRSCAGYIVELIRFRVEHDAAFKED